MKRILFVTALLLTSFSSHAQPKTAVAYFAGGCFWCIESDFEKLPGVISAVSGYTGGKEPNPTYEQVSAQRTSHIEAVAVTYDTAKLSYAQVLDYFWRHIDPLTANAQFCDHGPQYRSAIFYRNAAEQKAALDSRARYQKLLGQPIVTEILAAGAYYPAEDYHQDYAKKNPLRYRYYRQSCGRDARVKQVWGKLAP